MSKRYYWLKLQSDFFRSKRIKMLRSIAGGDTFTIIYLKMQLLALAKEGLLEYTGLCPTFAQELALDIDENPDNVQITVNFLLDHGLMETSDDKEFFLPYVLANTGSETASAQRSRIYRNRENLLQCNTDATAMQREIVALQQKPNVEKEKEKEKERRDRTIGREAPPEAENVQNKNRNISDPFEEFAKNRPGLLQELKAFEEMRKKQRKAPTEHAKELLLKDLQRFPEEQWIAIIQQSTMRGWLGFFELKKEGGNGYGKPIHGNGTQNPDGGKFAGFKYDA